MTTHTIHIASEFSQTPAGRFITDGPFSGERFRDHILVPALRSYDEVVVDLNGVFGFGSSFLEEAFGGLVRKSFFSQDELQRKMRVNASLKTYENRVKKYIADAKPE